jgi:hypothetical protein
MTFYLAFQQRLTALIDFIRASSWRYQFFSSPHGDNQLVFASRQESA